VLHDLKTQIRGGLASYSTTVSKLFKAACNEVGSGTIEALGDRKGLGTDLLGRQREEDGARLEE